MRLNTVAAFAAIAFTVLLFSPATVYYSNALEFRFTAANFLPLACLAAIVAMLVGSVLFSALTTWMPLASQLRLEALVVSLGFALWIQGTFIGWTLGPLDGRSILWQEYKLHNLDLLLWIFVIVTPQVVERLRSSTALRTLCAIVIATQAIQLTIQAFSTNEFTAMKAYRAEASGRFEFSSERNVILMILDEFQCDVFPELLQRDASLATTFSGFTFFRNALAPSKQTFPSVPAMLTGIPYDNSVPVPIYLESAFQGPSLFKYLVDSGVRTDVYPLTTDSVFISPNIVSNAVRIAPRVTDFLLLLDAGIFRSIPFVFKQHVFGDGLWLTVNITSNLSAKVGLPESRDVAFASTDIRAFGEGLKHMTVGTSQPVFKFNHLWGMHVPLRYDENLNIARGAYNRENYIRQAIGVLGVMRSLLQKLKDLNIYDRTSIIIAGDHGSGRTPEMWIHPSNPTQAAFNALKARACTLLLVKPFGPDVESSPDRIKVSAAPVTLLDITPTILEELGIDDNARWESVEGTVDIGNISVEMSAGRPLFSISETERRPRRYDSYEWERFNPLFLPPITEYIIDGDVQDDRSWKQGRVFLPPD